MSVASLTPPTSFSQVSQQQERSPSVRHFPSRKQEKKSPGRSKKMCLGNRRRSCQLLENDHGSLLLGELIMVLLLDDCGPSLQIASNGRVDMGLGEIGKKGQRCSESALLLLNVTEVKTLAPFISNSDVFANKLTFRNKVSCFYAASFKMYRTRLSFHSPNFFLTSFLETCIVPSPDLSTLQISPYPLEKLSSAQHTAPDRYMLFKNFRTG